MQSSRNIDLNNKQNNVKQKTEFIKFAYVVEVELKKIKKESSQLTLSQIQCLEFYKAELNSWEQIVKESFSSDNSCTQLIDKLKNIINRIEKSIEMTTLTQSIDGETQSQIQPDKIQNLHTIEVVEIVNNEANKIADQVVKKTRTLSNKCIKPNNLIQCSSVQPMCSTNSQSMDLFDDIENSIPARIKRANAETEQVIGNTTVLNQNCLKENVCPSQPEAYNVLNNTQSMDLFDSVERTKPKRPKRCYTRKQQVLKKTRNFINKSKGSTDLQYQSQAEVIDLSINDSQMISGLSLRSTNYDVFNDFENKINSTNSQLPKVSQNTQSKPLCEIQNILHTNVQVSQNKKMKQGHDLPENTNHEQADGSQNIASCERASMDLKLNNITQHTVEIDLVDSREESYDFSAETIILEVNQLMNDEVEKMSYEAKLEHLTKTLGELISSNNDDAIFANSLPKLKEFMEVEIPMRLTTQFKRFNELKTLQSKCNLKIENSFSCAGGQFIESNETVTIPDEPNVAQSLALSSDFGRIFNTNIFGIDFTCSKKK